MIALPDELESVGGEHVTGVSCPDCPGVLRVRLEGDHQHVFTCRIGHVYTLDELIARKERRIEEQHWHVVVALEELSALLRDAGVHPERAGAASEQAQVVRDLVDRTEPAVEVP